MNNAKHEKWLRRRLLPISPRMHELVSCGDQL